MKNQTEKAVAAKKDPYVTVEMAANELLLSENTIRDYCKSGVLKGMKNPVSGQWRIRQSSIDTYLSGK